MENNYIGHICQHCNTPIQEGDMVAVCNTCFRPQHLKCWQANRGCTTEGCTGMIESVTKQEKTEPIVTQNDTPIMTEQIDNNKTEYLQNIEETVGIYNQTLETQSISSTEEEYNMERHPS